MSKLRDLLRLDDFEPAARRHLPRPLFSYVSGGVEDNVSRRDNRAAFREYGFVPRVLVGVGQRSLTTPLMGRTYALPFGIAPMGIAAITAYRGDLVLAGEAARANVPMVLSGSSLIRLEEVLDQSKDAWFQAYLPAEEPRIDALVDRAGRAGYHTLTVTVDTQATPNREHNLRAGFTSPLRPSLRLGWDGLVRPRWLIGTFLRTMLNHGASFVLVGRPFNCAAAIAGAEGVRHAISLLASEIDRDMGMLGVNRIDALGPHVLHRIGTSDADA